MYYLDEIMDRTFENWSTLFNANNNSFWATSEMEIKPETEDADVSTNAPQENPAWEPADTNKEHACYEGECHTNPISETLHEISEEVHTAIDEINPFSTRATNNDE